VKICLVAPRFPYPTTKGDKLRVFHALKELSSRHEITLVAATDEPLADDARAIVARYCARLEVVPIPRLRSLTSLAFGATLSRLPLQTHFYSSPHLRRRLREVLAQTRFDIVHASLIRILPYVWDLEAPPVVVDLMDTFSRSIGLRRATAKPFLRFAYDLEARRVARYERAACRRFSMLFVCAEADRAALGEPEVAVVPTAADLDDFAYRREGRARDLVVVTGNMGYQPNVDAVLWFARQVWPRVRARRPEARFRVVGTRPAPEVRALDGNDGITVTGPVESVAGELQAATLSVCPTRAGSGMQIKVLEAMATGTPVVATGFANEGINAEPRAEVALADDPQAFAETVLALLAEPERRDAQARRARDLIERKFTWSAHAAQLEELYRRALASRACAATG
jgi:sugar transferase (PEP-CTERM/EpsH1 system associated)